MSALLVVILAATGEASHPATLGATGATREVLDTSRLEYTKQLP